MKVGCAYRAFPDGPIIKSYYDTVSQTVDTVPNDIIQLRNDKALHQFLSGASMTSATKTTWDNIMRTFGIFPAAYLIIGDSMYHTFAITPDTTFVYGLSSDEISHEVNMFTMNESDSRHTIFPQHYKSIGFVRTIPESYNYYQPIALFNVFNYRGENMIITKNGISQFKGVVDESIDFRHMNLMELAKKDKSVYACYQEKGVVKYYNI